jgi:hypothetical protein
MAVDEVKQERKLKVIERYADQSVRQVRRVRLIQLAARAPPGPLN